MGFFFSSLFCLSLSFCAVTERHPNLSSSFSSALPTTPLLSRQRLSSVIGLLSFGGCFLFCGGLSHNINLSIKPGARGRLVVAGGVALLYSRSRWLYWHFLSVCIDGAFRGGRRVSFAFDGIKPGGCEDSLVCLQEFFFCWWRRR
ncbi:hypothetical protein B0H11DRAFT_1378474 [Mycena galericulata]|nr:hypothetical protein B0H11DRAFT_1378474 [Mycena galericulata]